VLAALLGEMDCVKGEVFLPKEPTRLNKKSGLPMAISYCAQQPWLEHSKSVKSLFLSKTHTLRCRVDQGQHVCVSQICTGRAEANEFRPASLFGSPFDKTRYEATLSCCALLPDLAILEDGDNTVRATLSYQKQSSRPGYLFDRK
jgi:hypothetical protein